MKNSHAIFKAFRIFHWFYNDSEELQLLPITIKITKLRNSITPQLFDKEFLRSGFTQSQCRKLNCHGANSPAGPSQTVLLKRLGQSLEYWIVLVNKIFNKSNRLSDTNYSSEDCLPEIPSAVSACNNSDIILIA